MKRDENLAQLEAWFDRDLGRLFNYVVYRVSDQAAAEEIISRAAEQALKRLHQYDPSKGEFSAWMFGIARNGVKDYFRERERVAHDLPLDSLPPVAAQGETLEEQVIRAERFLQVVRQLDQLSESERETIALRYGAGLSYAEIAEVMGTNGNHVGVLLHRALARLSAILNAEKEEIYEPENDRP